MKKCIKLLLATYLVAQFLSIQHLSAFGFQQHKHNGQLCEFFLHFEKSKHSDLPTLPALPVIAVGESKLQSFTSVLLSKQHNKGAFTRAPPTLLLS